ncbi:thioredoxin domain-containing protein [Variibacter gotjawalensis]|uniref:thioredoxin domain-containing protein n=1 Tax=Variibacter gotjawalensis TaxID=1333996 RepID=UPI000BBB4C71|nr:thioredoxin domain-containing protein [Variibacter gotjawalensis]NIK48525.1 hypothetical protein [Variibacter gotjawalensis]RZS50390.1 hypothetical protein EV661_2854 [Variibacter gotjawalensis]
MPNKLAGATSPYLLQHQDNPVHWWPWSPEALAEAKQQRKPILLSIGYAACHWCHVMAHESFEDPAIAGLMNDLFVSIKVDREERPDIDQIYMSALHHLGEQGGWPLTMFLTPAGEPIWGGTYFPPTSRYGKPGFPTVLNEIARLFRDEPERIEKNRSALMGRLSQAARSDGAVTIGTSELDQVAKHILGAIDQTHGGVRGAPKFPQVEIFELVWRLGERNQDAAAFQAIDHTLDRICQGGIYDHLAGGFSRYSVDERWLVPHFEKMLYDNAQLIDLLAASHARTSNPLFTRRVSETIGWLDREMKQRGGAFAASLDADSEGEEGKFYVWSRDEITALLGADAAAFSDFYDVTLGGNFEGHNILNRLNALSRASSSTAAQDDADSPAIQLLRSKLLTAREKRIRPGLDDKILADWNGMMIAALVRAATVWSKPDWLALAKAAYDFVRSDMNRDNRLGHSWRDGKLLFPGLASDHAQMARAAIALYDATQDRAYLDQAEAWQDTLERHHVNADGSYYLTADDAEGLIIRPHATNDDATPNHNGVIADNLIRLATLTGKDSYRDRADRLLTALAPAAAANPFGHASTLNAIDFRMRTVEIVVTGEGADADALAAVARGLPNLNAIVLRASESKELPSSHPARAKAEQGITAAFVCVGQSCSLPITDPNRLAEAVA